MDERTPARAAPPRERAATRARAWAVALTLAACSAGCMARFQPSLLMRARSDDVELTLKEVRIGGVQDVVFQSHSTTPHVVHRAVLTVPTRAPCSGGEEAAEIEIDHGASHGTLTPGTHEIRARFQNSANDFALNLMLDLELEDGACARTPVVSQSVPLVAVGRYVVTASTEATITPDLSGLRGIVAVNVGGGVWLGRILVSGEAGLGSASCVDDLCGRDGGGRFRTGLAVPFALETKYPLSTFSMNRLQSTVLAGARYSVTSVTLPTLVEGDRRFMTHGAYAVLTWGIGNAIPGPFQRTERTYLMEAMATFGVLTAPGAPEETVGLSGGIVLRFLLPL